jgi:hypothetical protein
LNIHLQLLACALVSVAPSGFADQAATESAAAARGMYFSKKGYEPAPLPRFDEMRVRLPSPLFEENPQWVAMYWKSWELAFKNFHVPVPGSGYVAPFIDAAFNQNIFLWDTCFMTMFCNCAHPLVPGIASLDNFYAKQHADGEICREIERRTGVDYIQWVNREKRPLFSRWGWAGTGDDPVHYEGRAIPQPPPDLTLDALNHPIPAWAELESYRLHRVPTLAADQPGYNPAGGYWRGSAWAPTTTMVIRGLERYGRGPLAREIALNELARMGDVFQKTGTIWENYSPDAPTPGDPAKPDFVGWSGIGPILYLLEFAIGLKPDAAGNTLVWEVDSAKPLGCERFRFNSHVISLKAEPGAGDARSLALSVTSDGPFKLVVRREEREETYAITAGRGSFAFPK